jgi:hypothetical protein
VTTTPLLLLLAAAGANGLLTGASLDQSMRVSVMLRAPGR